MIVEQASINRNLNSISSLSIWSVSVRGGGGGRGNVACLYLKLCISDSRTSLYQQESKLYQLFVYPVCLSEGWGEGGGGRGNAACLYLKLCISDSRTCLSTDLNSISSLSIQSVSVRGGVGVGGM